VQHVHQLTDETNLAVLWATHLMDEISATDQLAVMHQGVMQAEGTMVEINQQAGTDTINDAFFKLTQG
jgi:ABC-2 type transport system ATP-binding protein